MSLQTFPSWARDSKYFRILLVGITGFILVFHGLKTKWPPLGTRATAPSFGSSQILTATRVPVLSSMPGDITSPLGSPSLQPWLTFDFPLLFSHAVIPFDLLALLASSRLNPLLPHLPLDGRLPLVPSIGQFIYFIYSKWLKFSCNFCWSSRVKRTNDQNVWGAMRRWRGQRERSENSEQGLSLSLG